MNFRCQNILHGYEINRSDRSIRAQFQVFLSHLRFRFRILNLSTRTHCDRVHVQNNQWIQK